MNFHPDSNPQSTNPHLLWIYPGRLDSALDSATWLKTTTEMRRLGWKVTLVSAGQDGSQLIQGVEVFCISSPEIFFFRQLIFHTKLIFFALSMCPSPQVILFNQPSALWVFLLFILRELRGGKSPILVMDTRTVPMEDSGKASLRDRLRGWFLLIMNRFGNSWADGQTAITRRMAERVRIRTDRLWGIWSSAADIPQFSQAIKGRVWPVGEEPIHLAYIGVLHYERNLLAICKAVEMAHENGMNFRLTLTGDGSQRGELKSFAEQTDGRILVNPPVAHEKIPEVLREAHVGVIPFPDEEKYRVSSPIKLYEYMAAGLPVLATRIVCHTDVINDDSFVFWAEGASPVELLLALKKVWQSRSGLDLMSTRSSQYAQNFTWAASAGRMSDALQIGLRKICPDFPNGLFQPNKRTVE
jgi:glycosyltransferase involved in cell wall biosynthesis